VNEPALNLLFKRILSFLNLIGGSQPAFSKHQTAS